METHEYIYRIKNDREVGKLPQKHGRSESLKCQDLPKLRQLEIEAANVSSWGTSDLEMANIAGFSRFIVFFSLAYRLGLSRR